MKLSFSLVALSGLFNLSSAFTVGKPALTSSSSSTSRIFSDPSQPSDAAAAATFAPKDIFANARLPNGDVDPTKIDIFPEVYDTTTRLEGGNTLRSIKIPEWATRVQYKIESYGRPMKGEVQLWLGPIRQTHTLKFGNEDGKAMPVMSTLKFKPNPSIKVTTSEDYNCPIKISLSVPTAERAEQLEKITETLFYQASPEEKKIVQGGSTDGGTGGQWVYWEIPQNVNAVHLIAWAVDTGKKSFRLKTEVLKGPNNIMQHYTLQCGGGSQPYHTVLQTPGSGWVVRMQNLKFMEDGKTEVVIMPYEKTTGINDVAW